MGRRPARAKARWASLFPDRPMHWTDRRFIRRYKKWLANYVHLSDCAYRTAEVYDRFTNEELNEFRAHPSLGYVERERGGGRPWRVYRNAFTATYNDFGTHLNPDADFNVYAAQTDARDVLLLLVD